MNVLFVEDDPTIRRTLSLMLSANGLQITTADSAEQALTLWAVDRFYAVLSDIGLPGMNGLALARQIRRDEQKANAQRPVRLIAITGEALSKQDTDEMNTIFDVVLQKPAKTEAIVSALNNE